MSPSKGKNHGIGEQYARFVYKTCILRFFIIHIGSQHSFELVVATIVVVEDNFCQLVVGFFVPYFGIEKIHFIGTCNFGLTVLPKSERPSKEQIRTKVEELLKLVQLSHLAKFYLH